MGFRNAIQLVYNILEKDKKIVIEKNLLIIHTHHEISCESKFYQVVFLSLTIIKIIPRNPATNKPKSSYTLKLTAALNPTIDHRTGIINTYLGIFLSAHNNKPKVKIVVGHGRPKVGDLG